MEDIRKRGTMDNKLITISAFTFKLDFSNDKLILGFNTNLSCFDMHFASYSSKV